MRYTHWIMFTLLILGGFVGSAQAAGPGQEHLDQATVLQVNARSLAELGEVIRHCQLALEQGLDAANEKLAKELLSSVLYQRATELTEPIFEQTPPNPRWPQLRLLALKDLEEAVSRNPKLVDAQLLIARLHLLPGGDRERVSKAVSESLAAIQDNPQQKALALALRASITEDETKRLADLNDAIKSDPNSQEALRLRGMYLASKEKYDEALADFNAVLRAHPQDLGSHLTASQVLLLQKKYDEALAHADKAVELNGENAASFLMRARVKTEKGDQAGALADLDQVLQLEPTHIPALMVRARLRQAKGDSELALGDIERVLRLRPGLPQGVILRSTFYAAQGNMPRAIADLESLVKDNPNNAEVLVQLGLFQLSDQRPRKALSIFDDVLKLDPSSVLALRGRADSLLNIGEHEKAIAAYEQVVKLIPDNTSVLNNLAWVLATSTEDKLRDGKRAVDLAKRAVELTESKQPNVLSTLAAAYAEAGDFISAVKWSTQAVSLSEGEMKTRLAKELQSYNQKKPWREMQQMADKGDGSGTTNNDLKVP